MPKVTMMKPQRDLTRLTDAELGALTANKERLSSAEIQQLAAEWRRRADAYHTHGNELMSLV